MPKTTGILPFAIMAVALRRTEQLLLTGGQQRARLNAWSAVCENRRHAADRSEAASLLPAERAGSLRHA
ncbi:hypothetical protein [Kitasatospora sp. P5_F3]